MPESASFRKRRRTLLGQTEFAARLSFHAHEKGIGGVINRLVKVERAPPTVVPNVMHHVW